MNIDRRTICDCSKYGICVFIPVIIKLHVRLNAITLCCAKKKTQKTLENNPFKKGIVTIFDSSLKINRHVDLIPMPIYWNPDTSK